MIYLENKITTQFIRIRIDAVVNATKKKTKTESAIEQNLKNKIKWKSNKTQTLLLCCIVVAPKSGNLFSVKLFAS